MSLIFDALKKLEREKDAREPGVLVVGAVPWGARTRSYRALAVALASVGLVALVAFALWPRDRGPRPATAPARPGSSLAPAPTPSAGPVLPPHAAVLPSTTPAPAAAAAPPERRRVVVPPAASGRDEAPEEDAAQGAAPPEETQAQEGAPVAAPLPPPSRAPAPDELRLNAISQRDGRPMALINDRLVFEGDSFDGVKILRIGESEVEVEVRGKRRMLRF